MKKFKLKALVKDHDFVLLNVWQESNLKGGTSADGSASVDNCDCFALGNDCKCFGNDCGPASTDNNCVCGKGKQNTKCDDNCNCYLKQTTAPSENTATAGPTSKESTSGISFWPGLI